MKNILFTTLFACFALLTAAQVPDTCTVPAIEELCSAMHTLWNKTTCREVTPKRLSALGIIQHAADSFSTKDSRRFTLASDSVRQQLAGEGILYFYTKSLDKVVDEVRTTLVPQGSIILWLVYNMGYVIKTPTACFAIDLCHLYAERLVPFLDFGLITHCHGDHYSQPFVKTMEQAGKPVVSNFFKNKYLTTSDTTWCLGDITIRVTVTDHGKSPQMRGFVLAYQINCGPLAGHCTILHSGDTANADQLQPSGPIDIFIPHVRVGLNYTKAIHNVHPQVVLMSHILELNHQPVFNGGYRWPFTEGLKRCAELVPTLAWMPVWGEKIVWTR